MSIFSRIAAWFRRLFQGDMRPVGARGLLEPIDTEELARELKLAARGRERGSKELPAADNESLDAIEQEVGQRIESEWLIQGDTILVELRAYASRLINYSVVALVSQLRLTAANAKTKLEAASHVANSELGPLSDAYKAARDELTRFRERHQLKRPPRQPSRPWTNWTLIILLIAIESIVNSTFFAKGAQRGLIGGFSMAVWISAANVIVAFLLGLWPFRWINHRNLLIKFSGLVFGCLGIGGLIAIHAFAVHFREAVALVGEDLAFSRARETLFEAPYSIRDISSVYLFGLGLLFALLSCWKGYHADDPYPRYGAAHRRVEAAREEYNDEHKSLFGELEELKEDTVAELRNGLEKIPHYDQQAAHIAAARDTRIQQFKAYEAGIETAANQLLEIYRDANRAARSTPAPKHFTQRWTRSHSFLDKSDFAPLMSPRETVSPEDTKRYVEELRRLSDEVLADYSALLKRYPHPTEMA